jgi:hypothetical protein
LSLAADLTIAVDKGLSVADANRIASELKGELHEHLPPLSSATVQFDTGDAEPVERAAHAHHHAPAPLRVDSPLASGTLAIVDTPEGERMHLTVDTQVDNLKATVRIQRPGGSTETLELLPAANNPHTYTSATAPNEPHEFDAELMLMAGERREVLPFKMEEPEGHHD